jgi:hypothetical protein
MFYTRPDLRPLGLDLIKIEGGGSCPAQFFGETADGQRVYIRYRGGRFSVDCGTTKLLDATIGPWLHGAMLVEQACDLAGITVRGERVILSEERLRAAAEEEDILDWSGNTTYWQRNLQVTKEGGQRLVETLSCSFPKFMLLEAPWDASRSVMRRRYRLREEVSQSKHGVILGFGADKRRLQALLSSDHVLLTALEDTFAHIIQFGFHWNDSPLNVRLPPFFDLIGRDIVLCDFRLNGRLQTKFSTADPNGTNRVEIVDLVTGEVTGTAEIRSWHSNDLREWSRAAPDRYLGWSSEGTGDAVRYLGFRPAMAPRE